MIKGHSRLQHHVHSTHVNFIDLFEERKKPNRIIQLIGQYNLFKLNSVRNTNKNNGAKKRWQRKISFHLNI